MPDLLQFPLRTIAQFPFPCSGPAPAYFVTTPAALLIERLEEATKPTGAGRYSNPWPNRHSPAWSISSGRTTNTWATSGTGCWEDCDRGNSGGYRFSSGRDSTLQESLDIQVATPNRGSTQRCNAIQAANASITQTKSDIVTSQRTSFESDQTF